MDAIAISRKYEGLPDLDSAPDIYETPELTEDASTVQATTVHTQSDDGLDTGDDVNDGTGISRSRLRLDEARSRFLPTHVDASDADFSDRVDGKRRSYRALSRRERMLPDGTRELGDLSDDENDEENLERKLARLRRETEEIKTEFARRKAANTPTHDTGGEGQEKDGDGKEDPLQALATLSGVLDEMESLDHVATSLGAAPSQTPPAGQKPKGGTRDNSLTEITETTYTVTYAPTFEQTHALAKAADFDRRLLLVEKTLGIGSAALPEADVNGPPRAIIPSIENLQRQVTTLSQASTASLDTTTRRVRSLAQEITQLNEAKARSDALAASKPAALGTLGGTTPGAPGNGKGGGNGKSSAGNDADQVAKINVLYGTLPKIESLAPLLPPLLDRLRSLRTLHADAAGAADALLEVEARQVEMEAELKMWREGLDKVEARIGESEQTMGGNVKVIEVWVKDLEARLEKLP